MKICAKINIKRGLQSMHANNLDEIQEPEDTVRVSGKWSAGVQLEDDARMDGINYLACSKCCHKSNLGSPVQTILTHILQIAASRSFTPPISDIRFYKRLTWYLS